MPQVLPTQEEPADAPPVSHAELPASHFVQGLSNPAHSCFFSSLLQFLASSAHLNSQDTLATLDSLPKVGPALSAVLQGINTFDAQEQPCSPVPLLTQLARKNGMMNGQSQQDSHEALMLLLELVDTEMRKEAPKPLTEPAGA
jgi:ubiquitin C-terminal hydrolase